MNGIVTIAVWLLQPIGPLHPTQPPSIPDKVEIMFCRQPDADSLHHRLDIVEKKLTEMDYYLRTHSVTDNGFHLAAAYDKRLHRQKALLTRAIALADRLPHTVGGATAGSSRVVGTRRIAAADRPLVAVRTHGGYWRAGHFHAGIPLNGKALARDQVGRVVCGLWQADTIVKGTRRDARGTYAGQMDRLMRASGQGVFDGTDGQHYEGFWTGDERHGFGFESSPDRQLRMGIWQKGRFLGERLNYTAERIYGIDISRHQHEKGRKRYAIDWGRLRITSLGKRHDARGLTFPVSFVYIKSTEGTTIRNRYFWSDYAKAKKQGLRVGAYHFFSTRTPAEAQAAHFVRNTLFRKGDFPPVLDVEPTDAQIRQMGGREVLLSRVRTFMQMVERLTGMRPILYINQMFVNKYLQDADDIKQRYNVWIARYGEYKPDVRLVYWQLSPDGRVDGIHGDVDINVFNGYKEQWEQFLTTGFCE